MPPTAHGDIAWPVHCANLANLTHACTGLSTPRTPGQPILFPIQAAGYRAHGIARGAHNVSIIGPAANQARHGVQHHMTVFDVSDGHSMPVEGVSTRQDLP
jgi:hypothetical protein